MGVTTLQATQGDTPETILAVGGHSADMDFTCGAILASYVQSGHRAVLLHCTPGEKGHPLKPPQEYEEQKTREAIRSAEILGAEVRFLPYKGNQFPYDDAARLAIAQVIRDVRPTIVITHWGGSSHKDHKNAHFNTVDATSYAALPGFPLQGEPHSVRSLYFTENWEDPFDYRADTLFDVSTGFERWHEAASSYELFHGERGTVSRFDFDSFYSSLFRMRGCLAGTTHAVGLASQQRLRPAVRVTL